MDPRQVSRVKEWLSVKETEIPYAKMVQLTMHRVEEPRKGMFHQKKMGAPSPVRCI